MRVLLATGGSLHSDAAVRFGAQMISENDDPPTILTVVRAPWQQSDAEKTVARARIALLPSVGDDGGVHTTVRVGRPQSEILRVAEELQSDLIVLGESPSHQLMTRLMGSVAMQITGRAPCSVLIAKGQTAPIRRILICDSGTAAPTVLECYIERGFVERIAPEAAVTILHVMSQISAGPSTNSGYDLRATAKQLMDERAPEGQLLLRNMRILAGYAQHLQPKVRHGLVVDEIVAEATEGDYDLVVIGAHRATGWARFLLDDLAYAIVAQIQRPILLVR